MQRELKAMAPKRQSRIEISRTPEGALAVTLYCEETKKMMPLVGMDYKTAIIVANLLVRLREEEMCLPEVVMDLFLNPSIVGGVQE